MQEWNNSVLAFLHGKVYSNGVIFCRHFAQSRMGRGTQTGTTGIFLKRKQDRSGFVVYAVMRDTPIMSLFREE